MVSEREKAFAAELRKGNEVQIASALILEAGTTELVFNIIKQARECGISPGALSVALLISAFSHIGGITKMIDDPEWTEGLKEALTICALDQIEALGNV